MVRGTIFTPVDEGYDDARRIWNGMHDRRQPALIARCNGPADVIAAVGFARSNDLVVAVRGGGHSLPGFSTCDDCLVIDLSQMNSVRVDPAERRMYVGGGAVWGDVDHETQAHGLATTGGLVSTTGVGGFTLGGGIGWLMRKHGLACDNLVGADVVTANGQLIHVSEAENADLLWGLRGGGGNFGIVTQFEFDLHPVGPIVYAGPIFYSADEDAKLLRLFREWAPGASDDISALLSLMTAPPLPAIPREWHGRKIAGFLAVSAGPVDQGERHVRDFRSVAEPIADLLGPMPYTAMQTLLDPLWPKGIHAYFKSTNLGRIDDDLINSLCSLHAETPGPQGEIHVHQMGGAISRVGAGETAFPERAMPFVLNAVAGWQDESLTAPHLAWCRAVIDAAAADSTGRAYGNFQGDAEAADLYAPDTYDRLVALKTEYDPTNVFHLNQNIEPTRNAT
jgi:FAD/FMN-containing dehydrogenase